MNFFALLIFSALVFGTLSELPSCYRLQESDEQWEKAFPGHEIRLFTTPNDKNFDDAKAHCQALGGEMIRTKTNETHDYLTTLLGDVGMDIWLGLQQNLTSGEITCVHGEPVDLDKWKPSNPDKTHSCINYYNDGTGWNSADCTTTKAFLCQRLIDYKCSRCKSLSVMAHYVGHDDPAPIPTCTEDKPDSFLSAQCAAATFGSDCYCADEYGKKINGSDTNFSSTLDDLATSCNQIRNASKPESECERRRREAVANNKPFSPSCQDNGNYEVRQCFDNTYCWCSMADGSVIPVTLHDKNSQTDAYCWKYRVYEETCGSDDIYKQHLFDDERFISCAPDSVYSCSCPGQPDQSTVFDPVKGECQPS